MVKTKKRNDSKRRSLSTTAQSSEIIYKVAADKSILSKVEGGLIMHNEPKSKKVIEAIASKTTKDKKKSQSAKDLAKILREHPLR